MQICPLALQDSRADVAVAAALTALAANVAHLAGVVVVVRPQADVPSVKHF